MGRMKTSTILAAIQGLSAPIQLCAQTKQVAASAHIETPQEFGARLTPLEKIEFNAATKAFDEHRYADSLVSFKSLLKELPAEPVLIKFASEAALQSGDTTVALSQLIPIVKANPDDWQALALLTRAYAESGDKIDRDSGIAQMLVLHRRGVTPSSLQKYIVERIKEGDNTLVIWTSVEPWGYYKVYALGQVSDSNGLIFLRITLESNDFDQPSFAREHPKEASEGLRQFSLDAYRETGLNNSGQRTQTHYTFQFFVGQQSYDTVREEFIKIATGKATPIQQPIEASRSLEHLLKLMHDDVPGRPRRGIHQVVEGTVAIYDNHVPCAHLSNQSSHKSNIVSGRSEIRPFSKWLTLRSVDSPQGSKEPKPYC